MQAPIADNFDLYINDASDGYYALMVTSPQGETQEPVIIPIAYNEEKLRSWLEKVDDATITAEELQTLGQRLGSYLLPPGVIRELFKSSLDQARNAGKRLRIRLRITPPEIAALPWELAYDESIHDFFVLHPITWLIRYPNLPIAPGSVASLTPVPILSIVAQPTNFPQQLNLLSEISGLIEACQGLLSRGAITVDLLFGGSRDERSALAELTVNHPGIRLLPQNATLRHLRDILRTQPYRILYFLGHGFFMDEAGGHLVMTDDQGEADLITDEIFARELQDRGLALAVLNACQSASQTHDRAFVGVAPRLIQAGLPAVIAMQANILDSSAILFAQTLYKALADGWPIDAAVSEARKAIRAESTAGRADWGTPVLFMRASDGQIFTHGVADEMMTSPVRALQRQAELAVEQAHLAHQQELAILATGIRNYLERLQKLIRASTVDNQSTPYRGLLAYRLSDSALFFGRQQAIQQLSQVLERGPLTVLQGQSGAGKTSLLQAGIAPLLVVKGSLVIVLRAYNQPPTLALQQTLLAEINHYPTLRNLSLLQFMQQVVKILGDAPPLYVIFDQFEEFFTQLDVDEQTKFMDEFAMCLNDSTLPVCWILALRTEFYGQLANFAQLGSNYVNQFTLKELSAAEAEDAIIRPSATYGIAVEEGLATQIVQEVRQQQDVLPPQLQIICLTLYERLERSEHTIITQRLYSNLGGARGILQNYLAQVLQQGLQPQEAAPARWLLEEFVTSTGQRILREQTYLFTALRHYQVADGVTQAILEKLVRARLLRVWESHAGRPGVFYELAHDYLIAHIKLDPGVQQRKEAEELLARAQINWEKYHALLDTQTFPVVHAQRIVLHIPENAFDLLVHSALLTGIEPAWWLNRAPTATAQRVLLEALKNDKPHVRRQAVQLAHAFAQNEDVQQALIHCVRTDADVQARRLALDILVQAIPQLRTRLSFDYWYGYGRDSFKKYQRLAFIILAPFLFAILGWNTYFWWISLSWERVPGAPAAQPIQALAVLDNQIFLGGRDSGFQHSRHGQWLEQWLSPPITPTQPGIYPAISAVSVDPVQPEHIYLYVWQQGLFRLDEQTQQWTHLGKTTLPLVEQPAIAVRDHLVLFTTQGAGLYTSQNGGETWQSSADQKVGQVLYVALFDQTGVAYVGGRNGLFRSTSSPVFEWEQVMNGRVQHIALGPDHYFYIAGEQATEVACYLDQPTFQPMGTPISFFWPFPGRKVTMLAAHPTRPGVFYVVDSFAGVYQFNCDHSRPIFIGRVWGIERGVNGIGLQRADNTHYRLIQASGKGLYWLSLSASDHN